MPNAVAEREPVDIAVTPNRDGQRILIIDDEAGIRDSLETLLTLEGFRVEMSADGQAGLDQLTRHSYDLLLLDLALPGESGIDLLPRIKSLAPDLPIIMITAYGTVNNVPFAPELRTLFRNPGTTRSCSPIFVSLSERTALKKRSSS
jgi:CheY-like chemotaxis protein